MAANFFVAGAVVLVSWLVASRTGTTHVLHPGACQRVESFLAAHVVGQDLALQQLVDAVCKHMDPRLRPASGKPLVMSVHGPPGVGKTFTHTLLAKALYNHKPELAVNCPGVDCMGAKVIYGLDFPAEGRGAQLEAVRRAILEHVHMVPDPVVVIEEYDKLDCDSRAMLRQLLDHAREVDGSGSLSRAIFLLESNLGFSELEQMLSAAGGDAAQLTPEGVERVLRDTLFAAWMMQHQHPHQAPSLPYSQAGEPQTLPASSQQQQEQQPVPPGAAAAAAGQVHYSEAVPAEVAGHEAGAAPGAPAAQGCQESYADTLRFMSQVDFFLPFLPLQRKQVEQLMSRELVRLSEVLWVDKRVRMAWDAHVVGFLVDKVDFDGPYPLEGAKQVASVATRYVSRAVRKCPKAQAAATATAPAAAAAAPGQAGTGPAGQPPEAWITDTATMRLLVVGEAAHPGPEAQQAVKGSGGRQQLVVLYPGDTWPAEGIKTT